MKRNPTIHISVFDLEKVLRTIELPKEINARQLAGRILLGSKPYQIRNRVALATVDKVKQKKITRNVESAGADVVTFQKALYKVRKDLKHKGVTIIREKDSAYLQLKEVAIIADECIEDFDFKSKMDGYTTFCKIAIKLMGRNYSLSRFKYYKETIISNLVAIDVIVSDKHPEKTMEFYLTWEKKMKEYDGIFSTITPEDYGKYIYFVDARNLADQYNIDYDLWITAQFEKLAFINVIPELVHFSNENAIERVMSYLKDLEREEVENDESTKNLTEKEKQLLKSIK